MRDEKAIRSDLEILTWPHVVLDAAVVYDRLLQDVAPLLAALAEATRRAERLSVAKAENDERFMLERDEARAERDEIRAVSQREIVLLGEHLDRIKAERDALQAEVERLRGDVEREQRRAEAVEQIEGRARGLAQERADAAVQALADAVRQAKLDVLDEAMVRYRKVHVGPSGGAYTMLRELRSAVSEGSSE